MINVLYAKDVFAAEAKTVASGTDIESLVMRASRALADRVASVANNDKDKKIAVFCGLGGNGGDGVVSSVMLKEEGFEPVIYVVGVPSERHARFVKKLDSAKSKGVCVRDVSLFSGADIIVDAIFGIGLKCGASGPAADVIAKINASNARVVSADIPSGLDADTGEITGACVVADDTVTFTCLKPGMLIGEGKRVCGSVTVHDVGVAVETDMHVYEHDDFAPYKRKANAHKGDSGRVFIIGGCGDMVGAPIPAGAAAHAALLSGAGLVTVCMPSIHRVALSARCTLAMMKFLPDTADGFIKFDKSALDEIVKKANAIDIGMGMGKCRDLPDIIEYLCNNFGGTLVIDADGISAVKNRFGVLKNARCKVVLTPHVGEFVRLTGMPATPENAKTLASDTGAIVVLKSATTVITDGKNIRFNITGTPAMAKGGTGDVLGGCIAALSCAFEPIDAATIACYRNGLGAERAVSSYAQTMLTPHDMLRFADYKEV